jgi:hypothetical protein
MHKIRGCSQSVELLVELLVELSVEKSGTP